jgi:hypothetical protein
LKLYSNGDAARIGDKIKRIVDFERRNPEACCTNLRYFIEIT